MRSFLLLLAISFSVTMSFAQKTTKQQPYIKINDILSFYQFEQIRDYILEKGDKQDYCENSGNAPHFKIKNTDIELYLINYSPKKKMESDDYSVLYHVTRFNGIPFNYYLHLTPDGTVYLYDYKSTLRTPEIKEEALSKLRKEVSLVLKEMKLDEAQ